MTMTIGTKRKKKEPEQLNTTMTQINENIQKIKKLYPRISIGSYVYKYSGRNKNLSVHLFESNPHGPWDLSALIENLPIENINKHIDRFKSMHVWYFEHTRYNVTLTEEFVDSILKMDKFYGRGLLSTPCVSIEYAEKILKSTNNTLHCLSLNPNITIDYIKNNKKHFSYYEIMKNPTIKLSDISELQKIYNEYDYGYVCGNPNLTFEYIRDNITKHWPWYALSQHKCITMEHIENTLNDKKYRWSWTDIRRNPNLTTAFVMKYKDKFLKKDISNCIDLTPDFIREHAFLFKWDWKVISKHQNITIDDIIANPDMPWIWSVVLENPNFFPYSFYYYKYNKHAYLYGLKYNQIPNQKCIRDYESKIELVFDLLCDDLLRIVLGFI
jgi:hypothetical protein